MKVNELIDQLKKLPQDQDISLYFEKDRGIFKKGYWHLSKIQAVGRLTGQHTGLIIKGY